MVTFGNLPLACAGQENNQGLGGGSIGATQAFEEFVIGGDRDKVAVVEQSAHPNFVRVDCSGIGKALVSRVTGGCHDFVTLYLSSSFFILLSCQVESIDGRGASVAVSG